MTHACCAYVRKKIPLLCEYDLFSACGICMCALACLFLWVMIHPPSPSQAAVSHHLYSVGMQQKAWTQLIDYAAWMQHAAAVLRHCLDAVLMLRCFTN